MSDVFFPDLLAQSPNERYRLQVQSPMNGAIADAAGKRVPTARTMQGNFRYALIDNQTGALLWERWQERNEGAPAECLVGDDGWVVVRTHSFYPQVFLIARTGAVAVRVKIRSTRKYKNIDIPADAETWTDEHAVESSAGLYWSDNSWRYFFHHDGKPYFAWRPFWGRRLVFLLDESHARRLTDEEANERRLHETMSREEGAWAASYVAAAAQRTTKLQAFLDDTYENRCQPNPFYAHLKFLIAAAHLCGVHQRRAAIPHLLELETLSFIRSYGSCRAIGIDKGWSLETEMFRPVVQHALRRLDQPPRGLPPFHYQSRDGRRLPALDAAGERRTLSARVQLGLTPIETLERIGAPDDYFEGPGKDGLLYWDYDFLEDGSWRTHRLTWSRLQDGNRLGAIDTIPAPWLTSTRREFRFLWG